MLNLHLNSIPQKIIFYLIKSQKNPLVYLIYFAGNSIGKRSNFSMCNKDITCSQDIYVHFYGGSLWCTIGELFLGMVLLQSSS